MALFNTGGEGPHRHQFFHVVRGDLIKRAIAPAFDPKDRARIQGGPAPKPLPALPLRLADGKLTVAGPFTGKVGGKKK